MSRFRAAPAAAAAPEPVPAAAAPAVVGGEVDWAAASASAGMPEKLFRRSVEAKAKAKGVDVAVVLAEMTGEPVPRRPGRIRSCAGSCCCCSSCRRVCAGSCRCDDPEGGQAPAIADRRQSESDPAGQDRRRPTK